MTVIRLLSPMAGWLSALDEVPDPVFAQRMMGDGFAIDPLDGLVRSPCDAEVISIPASAHAVTLALSNGAQLLIHVGLDTVALAGAGFTTHVAPGARVKAGDPLISFDMDAVAAQAKSLVTPVVVIGEGFALSVSTGRQVAAGETVAELSAGTKAVAEAVRAGGEAACSRTSVTRQAIVAAAHGVHARPAARIAAAAKRHDAAIRLEVASGSASARSPVALMALGLAHGDSVAIHAEGADAEAAVAAVAAIVEAEEMATSVQVRPAAAPSSGSDPLRLAGVCAAPGLAIGSAFSLRRAAIDVPEQGRGAETERAALDAALRAVAGRLLALGQDIAEAHLALLEDEQLLAGAEAAIASGRGAGFAWRAAVRASEAALSATGNALLIERIDDLRDVEHQVLAALAGASETRAPHLPEGAILLADLILPSQMMALDLTRLGAVCTAGGGPTSHAALLAAAAGVPMVVALGERLAAIAEGTMLVVDADVGSVEIASDPARLARATARLDRWRTRRAAEAAAAGEEGRLADGTRIEIFANLASAAEARLAVAAGAEGCGLLRTEFLFHDRTAPPDEAEQAEVYRDVARALGGRPLIIRTLDIGADKPASWLALPAEENPALGVRGVRLSLMRPDLLAAQLRAILAASGSGDLRIMVPMVVDADELRAVRKLLADAAAATGEAPLPLGVMIETPAAALLADGLAAEADFLSVGTNDLSQYALAADRDNPATAARIDALHPAVLRLIALAGEAAQRRGKWLGICGGVASDPLAAAILIGLGANELSATPAAIPALKAAIRPLKLDACRTLAAEALRQESAAAVRGLVAGAVEPAMKGAA
ncbi:phosphoenolpyruvate--protein phosphotransferase [Sphingosinicella terrae]|uniref:phosphoenolpyruvate--protein phosphotransferase n=1 Tax=Sphingosinicella terrae TaxID=2172047 RepID=UPI000E0DC3BC|nr:phosphoenolpyruvate--protein phosphotransferase [Sphingosinicella terrae]